MAEHKRPRIKDLFWEAGEIVGQLPPALSIPILVVVGFILPFWWVVRELRDIARRKANK